MVPSKVNTFKDLRYILNIGTFPPGRIIKESGGNINPWGTLPTATISWFMFGNSGYVPK